MSHLHPWSIIRWLTTMVISKSPKDRVVVIRSPLKQDRTEVGPFQIMEETKNPLEGTERSGLYIWSGGSLKILPFCEMSP